MHTRWLYPSLAVLALSTGCVSKGKYDAAVASATKRDDALKAERADLSRRLSAREAEIAKLSSDVAEATKRSERTAQALEAMRAEAQGSAQALDEATAINAQLRGELERLGKDVDKLLAAKGTLSASLEQARARLEELRRAQAAADARTRLFRDLALRLKRMVDAGELSIVLRSGRMVLVLPNDVLFDSGKAKIKARGQEALREVATVLATLDNRQFQVAGHTDNDPIRYSGFDSNWELSTERALEVVHFLIGAGMRAPTLSAAGYGEFDPLVDNDSPEHKAKNRRIEITLQPNIDELVAVPEAG